MKAKNNFNDASGHNWFFTLTLKIIVAVALVCFTIQTPAQAQQIQYTRPSWWFGIASGANANFYEGSTHQLTSTFAPPVVFHKAAAFGIFEAALIEYYRPKTRLGFMLQVGYDNRQANFDRVDSPCNCPTDLSTAISYITIEPSLRLAPFKSNLYLFGGPRVAFNIEKSFNYQLGINPAYPNQAPTPEVKGDLSDTKKTIISMQIGLGYDIPIGSETSKTQFVISPFASFLPYFGQNPRSIETLNITTIRAGVALKFGQGHLVPMLEKAETASPDVQFSVSAPANDPSNRSVREVFPLRNYVFFDVGSAEIPSRYQLLKKEDVKEFREAQLEMVTPINQSGRPERQMKVYYNVLNILGDRMMKNPSTTITLVGSSEQGPEDGTNMAEAVKNYLVTIFEITSSRIEVKGQSKPSIPSKKPGGILELDLLREGDRRVSIESNSTVILKEFTSGAKTPSETDLKMQASARESDVDFNVKGAGEAFSVWSVQLVDETGTSQIFGPYTQESVRLPRKSILGNKTQGDYKITLTGQTKSGKLVTKETTAHIVLWEPGKMEEGLRYSVLYEFDESKAIALYEKYLTEDVAPKIPVNGTVIIHGHTDIIGDKVHNLELSKARANDVKSILERALTKSGRIDVTFEVSGFGEEASQSPFDNNFPEERFYNRTVIIDIFNSGK